MGGRGGDVRLTPHEQERLLVHVAADVAQRRRARGPAAEPSRGGRRADRLGAGSGPRRAQRRRPDAGRSARARRRRRDGGRARDVAGGAGGGDVPRRHQARDAPRSDPGDAGRLVPGEIVGPDDPIEINAGRPVLDGAGREPGDRPVQVGSHYHFAEANPALAFDRGSGSRPSARRPGRHRRAVRARHRDRGRPRAVRRPPHRARTARRGRRPLDVPRTAPRELRSAAIATGRSTARPPATASASPTPTCGSRSPRTIAPVVTRSCSAAARSSASRWASRPPPGRTAHPTS